MEFRDLKHSVEKIELSNEMKNRIIQNLPFIGST